MLDVGVAPSDPLVMLLVHLILLVRIDHRVLRVLRELLLRIRVAYRMVMRRRLVDLLDLPSIILDVLQHLVRIL